MIAGAKFQHYQTLSSLAEYVTVAQDAPRIEHWTRQPDNRWTLAQSAELAHTIQLASIGCVLPLAEVYDKIEFAG
jgi:Uma2 family endonuclease